jgi:RNA polymerase sigma-70 factor (ECF subfamily)
MLDMEALVAEATLAKAGGANISLEGFDRWMAAEQRRIFLLCLRLLQHRDEADCATQDVFCKVHRTLEQQSKKILDDPAKWLTRITVNTCLDRLRSRRWQFWRHRPAQADEQHLLLLVPDSGPSPEQVAHHREIAARLSKALDKLSLRQRAVFILRHEEDMSLQAISDMLGLDIGTIKTHLFRAIRNLRQELRDLYAEPTLE